MTDNHGLLLEAYKDIAAILRNHGITFYGAYGTAIGAIRHNGFIPWDDDLDLAIHADDLDEVNRALSSELDPERYYYHIPSADTHPHVIIKTDDFEKELEERRAQFIDIFILVDSPDSVIRRALSYPCYGFELMSHMMIDRTRFGFVRSLFYRIQGFSRRMARAISKPGTARVAVRAVDVGRNTWDRAYFDGMVNHPFEDTEIPLPSGCDSILREFYGDYMTPPPEDQRSGASGYPYSLLRDYLEDRAGGEKRHRLCRADLPLRSSSLTNFFRTATMSPFVTSFMAYNVPMKTASQIMPTMRRRSSPVTVAT